MKELSFMFPTGLTDEENHMKVLQEKLKNLRRLIHGRQGPVRDEPIKPKANLKVTDSKRSFERAQSTTEEVKKKIMSGMIKVTKVDDKKGDFKRAKIIGGRLRSSDSAGEPGELLSPSLLSPTLGSPTCSSSWPDKSPPTSRPDAPPPGKTLYIRGYDLQKDSLENAFKKFGELERVSVDDRKKSAFIEFVIFESAEKAVAEMDGYMVNGITIRVSYARRQTVQPRPFIPTPLREVKEKKTSDRKKERKRGGSNKESKEKRSKDKNSSDKGGAEKSPSSSAATPPEFSESGRKMMTYGDDIFG